jgi:archaeosine synthase beta-subunit
MVEISRSAIVAARPPKNQVDPRRPYLFFVEEERTAAGTVETVATVFLTNRECPWRCLMCDLWKNTTDESIPPGAIVDQIDFALQRLPPARHIKLYNSGSFFDAKAVPPADHAAIASRLREFQTVIVENHPRLCTERCLRFRDLLFGQLEIAMGLETVHPDILAKLNKGMTLDDFDRAANFLCHAGVQTRAFILLRPPYLSEQEGIEWGIKSLAHALELGIGCSVIIPTRAGNGIMDELYRGGNFARPRLKSLEQVVEAGLRMLKGACVHQRVFLDLWNIEALFDCPRCGVSRAARLREMNLTQRIPAPVSCECDTQVRASDD